MKTCKLSVKTRIPVQSNYKYALSAVYSKIAVARTLIARIPRLFRTRSRDPKKIPCCRHYFIGITLVDFYTDNGMLCVLIRIVSVRRF